MQQLLSQISLNGHDIISMIIDIAIGLLLLGVMRWFYSLWGGMDFKQELAKRDNFAVGISIAGTLLSLAMVLTSIAASFGAVEYKDLVVKLLSYGLVGVVLIKIGHFAHDRIVLYKFSKHDQILGGNVSIAFVDAAGAIATATIVAAVLRWAKSIDINGLIAILTGFIVALSILLITTRIFEYQYAKNNQNDDMQEALCRGQFALAVRHAGHILGVAIAVTAAAEIIEYQPQAYVNNLLSWLFTATLLTTANLLLTRISKRIVLYRINLVREVDHQHNVGIAAIEMVLSVGMAMLLTGVVHL